MTNTNVANVHNIIKSLPQNTKMFLLKNTYVNKKEIFLSLGMLSTGQQHQIFEDLILNGILVRYASYWKIPVGTKKLLMAYDETDRMVTDIPNAEDTILISECLGINASQFIFNTKSFQIKNIEPLIDTGYVTQINEILSEFGKRGYLSKSGTTYNVTEKFRNMLKRYFSQTPTE